MEGGKDRHRNHGYAINTTRNNVSGETGAQLQGACLMCVRRWLQALEFKNKKQTNNGRT